MGFIDRVKQRMKEANPKDMVDEQVAADFGNTTFGELPKALRNRCLTNLGLFVGIGVFSVIIALAYGVYPFLLCSAILILFGVITVYFIIRNFKNGEILEITGVVTQKDREGYRKQHKYINIEDDNHRVYRLLLTEKSRRFKVGDMVTFYTTKDSISQPVDAEYRVSKLYAIERFNASVTEEDAEQDNLDDLVIKPKSEQS